MKDNNKIRKAQLVSKTGPLYRTYIASTGIVSDVVIFGCVYATTDIDSMCSQSQTR